MIKLYFIEKKLKNKTYFLCGNLSGTFTWCKHLVDAFMFSSQEGAESYCKHNKVKLKNIAIKNTENLFGIENARD